MTPEEKQLNEKLLMERVEAAIVLNAELLEDLKKYFEELKK